MSVFETIDKFIKVYQGGATGLVQQKNLKKYPSYKYKKGKIMQIKDILKEEFGFELVLFQVGFYIEIIDEDAHYFKKHFDFTIHDGGGTRTYATSGFPKDEALDKYITLLNERNLNFCLVEQTNIKGEPVIRSVTYCSKNEEALGVTF